MKLFLIFILLISFNCYSQKVKIKTNIVEWRKGSLGKITIDDSDYTVKIMWTQQHESTEETMLYTSEHRISIEKTPLTYYKTIYYKNGKIDCVEIPRIWFLEWIMETFLHTF